MSQPLSADDPCYWMLEDGLRNLPLVEASLRKAAYKQGCYICEDPEFALMGLPLCYHCSKCGGHVAADDSVCDDCGHDNCPEPEGGEG